MVQHCPAAHLWQNEIKNQYSWRIGANGCYRGQAIGHNAYGIASMAENALHEIYDV
jgi:hypothetical protein